MRLAEAAQGHLADVPADVLVVVTRQGCAGKVIAQLMGHANVDTTLNVHTQVLDGSLRAAADKVGSELFTIVHKPEEAASLASAGPGGETRISNERA